MSYWIELKTGDEVVSVPSHSEGGTYVMGGIDEALLNVTYNYGGAMREAGLTDGLRSLHGQRAEDTVPMLEHAVEVLGTERDPDYWAATEGNAGYALSILLGWARQHPNAVWEVS